ncbi:MAG: hypothetical protein GC131_00720 [Alphaproteobacteria bacterium]|nr:hypothetical protein [Alphaproteobacteria bacterium]
MPKREIIEDIGQLLAGLLQRDGLRAGLRAKAKGRAELLAKRLDLVTQAEYAPLRAMIAAARTRQEEIATRLARVEKHLGIAVKPKVNKSKESTSVKIRKSKKTARKRRA